MKLSKDAISSVLNYIIEKQTFDFEAGKLTPVYITSIVDDLSNGNETLKQDIACSIIRCINEELISSNYPRMSWISAEIFDVTFKGFEWIENN